MNKKIIGIIALIIVILLVIFAFKNNKESSSEPVRLGAILSETGVAASFGEMSRKGIELAVKEINDSGGVNGRKVEVIFEDDQTNPTAASGAFQKLNGIDNVDAIIGSNFDFVTQPLFSLAQTNKVVVISPSNPRIKGAFDPNDYSFVMMTEFDVIVKEFEEYLKNTQYSQLGIVRFESSFSESIMNTLNGIQTTLGKKPIIAETYKEIGNNDFRTIILKLKQANVDLVFLDMVANDPVVFMTQAKQLGYSPKVITHVGIQDALAMKDSDPKIFDGVVSLNWNVSPQSFTEKFTKAYGMAPDKSANRAYDSVYVLAQAVSQTKDLTNLPQTLENEVFTTPNGEFKFNENHAAENTEVRLEIVKDGKLTELK